MKKLIRRTVSAMLALLLNAGLLCAVPAQAASADAPAAAVETAAVGSDGEDGSETAEQEPSAAAETQTETISGKSVSDCTVSLNQTSFYFNGKARYPAVTVTDGSVTLARHAGSTIEIAETAPGAISGDRALRWWLDGDTLRVQYAKSGFFSTGGSGGVLSSVAPLTTSE